MRAKKGEVHHQCKYGENALVHFFKTLCPASKLNITKEIFQYERCTPRDSSVSHIAVGLHQCDTPAFDLLCARMTNKSFIKIMDPPHFGVTFSFKDLDVCVNVAMAVVKIAQDAIPEPLKQDLFLTS